MEELFSAAVILIVGGGALYILGYPFLFLALRWRARRKGRAGISAWTLVPWFSFTLVVLLTVPQSLRFSARAMQSEARTNLGAIYTVQQSYFSNSGTYAGGPAAYELLNWGPAGGSLYAYYCGEAMIENTKGITVTQRPGGDWPNQLVPESSVSGFTCMAVGNVDNDPYMDVWAIDDAKRVHNVMDDVLDSKEGEWDQAKTERILILTMTVVFWGALVALAIRGSLKKRRAREKSSEGGGAKTG